MKACLESAQRSKMDPITFGPRLTVTDRRPMWLQKQHPNAHAQKLQLWACGVPRRDPDGKIEIGQSCSTTLSSELCTCRPPPS